MFARHIAFEEVVSDYSHANLGAAPLPIQILARKEDKPPTHPQQALTTSTKSARTTLLNYMKKTLQNKNPIHQGILDKFLGHGCRALRHQNIPIETAPP